MPFKKEIKKALAEAEISMSEAIKRKNELYGTADSIQNICNKIRSESIRYSEAEKLADVLGFKIVWIEK